MRNRLVGRGRRWAIKTSPRTERGDWVYSIRSCPCSSWKKLIRMCCKIVNLELLMRAGL